MTSINQAQNNLVVLAAGGTGGHVFPALAVARTLRDRGYQTILFTDPRGAKLIPSHRNLADKTAHNTSDNQTAIKVISAASPFSGGPVARTFAMTKICLGMMVSMAAMLRRRPLVMIGFGGYPSFGPMASAKLLSVPMMVHEQNGFLGRANRALARLAGHLALSWPDTKNLPDNVATKTTGMPVRDAFFDIPAQDRNEKINILIIGGSQGAAIFADLVPAAIGLQDKSIRQRIHITQQCRAEQTSDLIATYAAMDVPAKIAPFFDDVPDRMADSHLVISRSGASSVAEMAAAGRPAIMIPLPTAMDDHQTMNAAQLAATGGGIVLAQKSLDAHTLAAAITTLISDLPQLAAMGAKAHKLAKPDAASAIADYALQLVPKSTNTPSIKGGVA